MVLGMLMQIMQHHILVKHKELFNNSGIYGVLTKLLLINNNFVSRTTVLAKQLNTIAIPHNILAKNKVSQEEIIRAKSSERLNECVFEVATRAHQHLMKARSLQEQVPKEARDVLLPAVPISNYLDKLQKVDYDIFHPSLKQRGWLWLPMLWIKHVRKKY